MKKTLFVIPLLIILAACGPQPESPASAPDSAQLQDQLAEKDQTIQDLEEQLAQLTEEFDYLQEDYDALLADEPASPAGVPSSVMCDSLIENMRYQNPASAIAILEGWFAVQPQVAELQGKYSTQFWSDVNSRIHTIRYLSAESGLSETATFLIFFEEAGWRPGLLDMTHQCWLDYPD